MTASDYLRRQPRAVLAAIGALLVILSGFMDHITGLDLSFLLFYLIPVWYFAWFISRKAGALVSILCVLVWISENVLDGKPDYSQISYLNMSIQLVFFFLTASLLCTLKSVLGINEELSRRDFLTGAMNRDAFYDLALREVARLERYMHPFTVAYMDVDNFKVINYRFGHHAGDRLLCAVADTIRKNLRKVDLVARFGGDEFTILLPETGAEAAQVVLSRIRNVLLNMMENNKWPVTFTFGTVTFLKAPASVEEMMKKVGSVMYSAKDSGMNTIEQEIVNA